LGVTITEAPIFSWSGIDPGTRPQFPVCGAPLRRAYGDPWDFTSPRLRAREVVSQIKPGISRPAQYDCTGSRTALVTKLIRSGGPLMVARLKLCSRLIG